MSTEIVKSETSTTLALRAEMTVDDVVARQAKFTEVMDRVMKKDKHYGTIPGCGDKPTLFKAGAEVLATTFMLAPRFVVEIERFPEGHREYRVACIMRHVPSGMDLGEGLGSCSTMESKYRWRKGGRSCPTCHVSGSIIKGKAEYGGWVCFVKKSGCGAKFADDAAEIVGQAASDRVENPDIANEYNTVLKIAKKRAQVDATLTVTGASDVLTQDLEDLPKRNDDAVDAEYTEEANLPPSTRPDDLPLAVRTAKTVAELEALDYWIQRLPADRLPIAIADRDARMAMLRRPVMDEAARAAIYASFKVARSKQEIDRAAAKIAECQVDDETLALLRAAYGSQLATIMDAAKAEHEAAAAHAASEQKAS